MAAISEPNAEIKLAAEARYKHGFVTEMEQESAPKGLGESTVRFISAKKQEPAWLLDWRLKAYRRWLDMAEPRWAKVSHPPIDYQDAYYFSAPKLAKRPKSLAEVDPRKHPGLHLLDQALVLEDRQR